MWSGARVILDEVAFSRGEHLLANGISIQLAGGDALALVGPNGSGKTSLLRVLAGLAEPEDGTLTVSVDSAVDDVPRAALVHLGGHQDGLKTQMTVRENLAFWRSYFGVGEGASIACALKALAIGHLIDLPVGVLSQGQKRRVALARLTISPRPIWLLDEPTAALDVASSERFLNVVEEHRAQGGIVVAATHTLLDLDGLQTLDLSSYAPQDFSDESGEGTRVRDAESYWLEGAHT